MRLANLFKPIVFLGQCFSGSPEGVYYRIVGKSSTDSSKIFCIQYFYYWDEQFCLFASHRYDYEPIFVYVRQDEIKPFLIINGGLGQVFCRLHKIEIRPEDGERSEVEQHCSTSLSPSPFYPFGSSGTEKIDVCYKTYPLSGNDLRMDDTHPVFGIRSCSNVFSGANVSIHGPKLDPPIRELTDNVLDVWYNHHYEDEYDMPFGHDLANPFKFPYMRYRCAKESIRQTRVQDVQD
jgi:hypothetical protein